MAQRTVFDRLTSVAEHRQALEAGVLSPHLGEASLPPVNVLTGPYLDQIARTHPERLERATELVSYVAGGAERRG